MGDNMENVDREINYEKQIKDIALLLNEATIKLNALNPTVKKSVSPDYIIDGLCQYYNTTREKISLRFRGPETIKKRQLLVRLLDQHSNCTQDEIAELLGYTNHTTVIHHLKKMADYMSDEFYGYDDMKKSYNQLLKHLKL
jgi:chromosomal replication initiation ATPase DnaA